MKAATYILATIGILCILSCKKENSKIKAKDVIGNWKLTEWYGNEYYDNDSLSLPQITLYRYKGGIAERQYVDQDTLFSSDLTFEMSIEEEGVLNINFEVDTPFEIWASQTDWWWSSKGKKHEAIKLSEFPLINHFNGDEFNIVMLTKDSLQLSYRQSVVAEKIYDEFDIEYFELDISHLFTFTKEGE